MASKEEDRSYESRFKGKFSKEPVYGEGVRTYAEESWGLVDLQECLDRGEVCIVGSSIVGSEVSPSTQDVIQGLHLNEQLGASVFCGEVSELITEDGGLLVIGDNCVIYNSHISVAKGCVLMIEDCTILGSNIVINKGEHKLTGTNLSRCRITNSTLNKIESKESDVDNCLLRDGRFMGAKLNRCIGSLGGSELGGILEGKSISYYLHPELGTIELKLEDVKS